MKLKSTLAFSLCVAIGLGAAMLYSGCESAEDFSIDISPAYAEVTAKGQTVTLTASGWSGYTWSLSSEEWGYLTSHNGKSVSYVVTEMPTASSTLTVTATGLGTGAYNSASNTTSGVSGSAKIRHVVSTTPTP
jgi:hypothetical protein